MRQIVMRILCDARLGDEDIDARRFDQILSLSSHSQMIAEKLKLAFHVARQNNVRNRFHIIHCVIVAAWLQKNSLNEFINSFLKLTGSDSLSTRCGDFSLYPAAEDEVDNKLGSAQRFMIIVRKASINCLIAICIPLCIYAANVSPKHHVKRNEKKNESR